MEKKSLAELCADAKVKITDWNTAMFEGNLEAAEKATKELDAIEKDYLAQVQLDIFEQLRVTEKPMCSALLMHSFSVIKHVDKKLDKESELYTREFVVRERQIDILRFEEHCTRLSKEPIAHDTQWKYMVQRFNQLMCLRAAKELKCSKEQVDKITTSYYLAEKAKEIKMGGTPTSNNQMIKQLQMIVDAIIYEEGEHGNVFKVNSHDIAFLLSCYTRKGKEALSVATANHTTMRNLICTVCHQILTQKGYKLEFKEAKTDDKKAEVTLPEAKIVVNPDKDTKKTVTAA